MYSLVAMFLFSALGGAWFPLSLAGPAFSAAAHLLPTAWAMEGYQNIVLRGLGAGSLLLPAGILLAYTVAFFGLAVWRFRSEPVAIEAGINRGGYTVYFLDPDDITLEIIQAPQGVIPLS